MIENPDDRTEPRRRQIIAELNRLPRSRRQLEAVYGDVWDSEQLSHDFVVLGYLAPFCVVSRHLDGKQGTLMFQDEPRFYFGFTADQGAP